MLTTIQDSLKSKVLQLECLHHYCMQLREVAEILYDELQTVANDEKTLTRLGNAGKERVRRDFKTLFVKQQDLHNEIELFIKSNNLTISLPKIPTGFCASDFKKTFALDGPYNTVITNLLITICKEDSHAEEK